MFCSVCEDASMTASTDDRDGPRGTAISDGRLLRGTRTRQTIARHAVDVASREGLGGLTIGRLAGDLGVSKSGVQTLFGTKEQLQLTTIETALAAFQDAVVRPAAAAAPGLARLRALIEHWITYAEAPLFPGGCFWTANLADFDSRPGPLRDELRKQHASWLALLADQVRRAVAVGELTGLDPADTAFQLDATLTATNIALRLGETHAVDRARRAIDAVLTCERPCRSTASRADRARDEA
jgi:AcrR family transcriptional regulator